MTGSWFWLSGTGLSLVAWSLYCDIRHDTTLRLASWWVPRARHQGRWAGPMSLLTSIAAPLGYAAVAVLGGYLAQSAGNPLWALLVCYPAMAVYSLFVFTTLPTKTGYHWRFDLREAGADAPLQRRIAWWAGAPSIFGLSGMVTTLIAIFFP